VRLYHSSYHHNPFRKFSRKFRREVGGYSVRNDPAILSDAACNTTRHPQTPHTRSETLRDRQRPSETCQRPSGWHMPCLNGASILLQISLCLAMLMRTHMMNKTFVSFDTDPCASIYKLYKVSGKYSSSLGRSLRAHSRPALEISPNFAKFRQIWRPGPLSAVRKRRDGLRTPPRESGVATHTIPAPWEDMTHLL
jgi:hypothetical protein